MLFTKMTIIRKEKTDIDIPTMLYQATASTVHTPQHQNNDSYKQSLHSATSVGNMGDVRC